jgi:hypothetical protein
MTWQKVYIEFPAGSDSLIPFKLKTREMKPQSARANT